MAKALTECLSFIGNYNETTKRRIDYFQNIIKIFQKLNLMNDQFNPQKN